MRPGKSQKDGFRYTNENIPFTEDLSYFVVANGNDLRDDDVLWGGFRHECDALFTIILNQMVTMVSIPGNSDVYTSTLFEGGDTYTLFEKGEKPCSFVMEDLKIVAKWAGIDDLKSLARVCPNFGDLEANGSSEKKFFQLIDNLKDADMEDDG